MKESNNLKQKYNYYVQRIDELNEGAIKNIVYLLHTIGNGIIWITGVFFYAFKL